jgi:aspartokinase/homoserine dehydrogenase 1
MSPEETLRPRVEPKAAPPHLQKVLKFGGSTVGDPARIGRVLERVAEEAARGPIAVVVSAMGDGTDELTQAIEEAARGALPVARRIAAGLVECARSIAAAALETSDDRSASTGASSAIDAALRPLADELDGLLLGVSLVRVASPELRDRVASFGERLSATTIAVLLRARGVDAVSVDARTWVVTDARFGDARVDVEASRARLGAIAPRLLGRVAVHTGYIGATPDGRTTTLGRNGSDYTASLLASLTGASGVDVWTASPGVMTADPELVAEAYPVPHLTYREALELARFGARMFHARTMIPLIESGIPLTIRSLVEPDAPGTRIDAQGADDVDRPTSVTSLEGLALLDVDARRLVEHEAADGGPLGARVLAALEARGVRCWMATQSGHGQAVSVVVSRAEFEAARAAVERVIAPDLARSEVDGVRVRDGVTLVTLVAEAMGRSVNVAGRLFGALGRAGITVCGIAQSASSRSISCVVDGPDTAAAVRAVHAAFNLASADVSVVLLGYGVVGREFVAQLRAQAGLLAEQLGVSLRLVGVADSQRQVFDARGLPPGDVGSLLARATEPRALSSLVARLRHLPVPVLVDCTAADGMEAVYTEAFAAGVHVVAANKKPLTTPWGTRAALFAAARRAHRFYHYETTVGASLPVLDTLMSLVRTGDRVERVEGSLSGTLGFLSQAVSAGTPLSVAVREAKARGYTEPHPRDDLNGLDVARKAIILARELGLEVALEDVVIEPFVPTALLAEDALDVFYSRLEAHDAAFAAEVAAHAREGKVLRYLARVEPHAPGGPRVVVGPTAVDARHPASRLRSTEAFVAFTTARYAELPLVVQGAGAGGAVTAAGVLTDVLRIAQALRGR